VIVKATSGSGFLGTLLYALHGHRDQADADKGARIVGGNMSGQTARTLSREFSQLRKLRPNLGKAVAHFSLSFSPEERHLSNDELARIADEFMHGMGYERAAYVCIRHGDTEHQHVHVVACRATCDGKTVADGRSFRRAEAVARRLEVAHGLLRLTTNEEKKMQSNDTPKTANDKCVVDPRCSEEVVFEVESGEEMKPRKARELRRLALTEEYRQRLIVALGASYKSMSKTTYGLAITTTDGGRIIDRGDSVRAYRMSNEDAARHLVAIGLAKNWMSMRFSGHPDFLRLAFIAAVEAGIEVVPKDEEQRKMLNAVAEELRQRTQVSEEAMLRKLGAEQAKVAAMDRNATVSTSTSKTLEEEAAEVARQLRQAHITMQQQRAATMPTPTPIPGNVAPLPPPVLPKLNGMGGLNARLLAIREESERKATQRRGPAAPS
jgi:hypothetical protein